MKVEARLFYDGLRAYLGLTAPDVRKFMEGKSFPTLKSDMRRQISTAKIDGVINIIRTTSNKSKTIMRQVLDDTDIDAAIDEWVDDKVYSQLLNDLMESVYDKLAGVV